MFLRDYIYLSNKIINIKNISEDNYPIFFDIN